MTRIEQVTYNCDYCEATKAAQETEANDGKTNNIMPIGWFKVNLKIVKEGYNDTDTFDVCSIGCAIKILEETDFTDER